MNRHEAPQSYETAVLEARAVALAERGQFPDGFGRHRAPIDPAAEHANNLRANELFTVAS